MPDGKRSMQLAVPPVCRINCWKMAYPAALNICAGKDHYGRTSRGFIETIAFQARSAIAMIMQSPTPFHPAHSNPYRLLAMPVE
jgi:hypothetical protein